MARTGAHREPETNAPGDAAGAGGSLGPSTGRGALRRAARAERLRALRLRRVSIVTGALLAVAAVWALAGRPAVTLVPGDSQARHGASSGPSTPAASAAPLGSATTGPSGTPSTASGTPQGSMLPVAMSDASGQGLQVVSGPTLAPTADGFARICGHAAASDRLLVGSVSRTLRGDRAGGSVTIVQSEAVYRPGGMAALLAEAARCPCADRSDPLPGYPPGSVLLRGRGNSSVAYLVTATGPSTALYVEASSTMEDSVVDALFTVVPGLITDAQAGAAELAGSMAT